MDRKAKRELKDLGVAAYGDDQFRRSQVVERALARAASGNGVIAFGKVQPYAPQNLRRIIKRALAPDPKARYQQPSDMIGDLEALRLPDWRPSVCAQGYAAHGWSGWDWVVERDARDPGRWVISRRRETATGFRRWATAKNAREACRRVGEVAA